jgi:hypothetical protein
MKVRDIERKKCVRVFPDGALAVTEKSQCSCCLVKEVARDGKFVHCSIHREAVAARRMPAVKVVNFFNSRATNSRLFSILCNEMGRQHDTLLHTEVRWLP